MTTDDLMSRDPVTPAHGMPAQTGSGRPDWLDADPADPFAYREQPAWATEPTSVHQPLPAVQPPDPDPAADLPQAGIDPLRESLARLRAAGTETGTFFRETISGMADIRAAYTAAAADHAAGLPLPAAQPPGEVAAGDPRPAAPVPAVLPPPASLTVGRHRREEPPPPPPRRFRGMAAVLPWNWRRR